MLKKLPILLLALAIFCLPFPAGAAPATKECAGLTVLPNDAKIITLTIMRASDTSRQFPVSVTVPSPTWCGAPGDGLDTLAVGTPASPTDTRTRFRLYDLGAFRQGGKAAITYTPDSGALSVTVDGKAVPAR